MDNKRKHDLNAAGGGHLEALIKVYVAAARLRTFPVPFDDHFELVGVVDQCRSVLDGVGAEAAPDELLTREVSIKSPKIKEEIIAVAHAVIARSQTMERLAKKLADEDTCGLESSMAVQLERLATENSAAARMLATWLIQEHG